MTYIVLMPNGQRYGPADVATLNAWAAQGGVQPFTELEEVGTGRRMAAQELPGMVFPPSGGQG